MGESDQEAIQSLVDKKLAALRAAIKEGLESGPAESFDMEAILAEARADHLRRKDAIESLPAALADLSREARENGLTDQIIEAELRAWRNERKN